jgi:halocarboxylic acid dehydrogenase DehI
MPLTRALEEHDLSPDLRRTFTDIRGSFGLPFAPTLFKLAASVPEYLTLLWNDLGPVVRSREFQGASRALHELVASSVNSHGWRFSDQAKTLASQKFTVSDIGHFAVIASTIERAAIDLALFTRLAQRGYSGGQKGKITSGGKHLSASSQLFTLHVPPESEAGLRTWLIYSDIKRTLGNRYVFSFFRILSPFPSYLSSVWMESKRLLGEPQFHRSRDEMNKRTVSLLTGLPVKDHRALGKRIAPEDWRNIEESIDDTARLLPQMALIASVWRRSFATAFQIIAA